MSAFSITHCCSVILLLSGKRVGYDVDPKLGIVFGQKAFIPEVVIPFAAVVFVAIENANSTIHHNGFEVVMHEVVAPAVQLERRGRRPFGKFEKAGVEGMVIGNLLQNLWTKRSGHLLLEGFGKQPVDVMIAIIHEHEPTMLHVTLELFALVLRKFNQFMTTQVTKWAF
ncbi:MAG: hypothetical protein JWP57_3040 [Spirosoma sp.]|nr:hypothetical protein [Spirosoma sp.]